ncbi:hypothetical protein GCM10009715_31690 [Paeniglutamicibacter psychrophenolicus]|uniref:Plasmid pRiA4b Orf3-like domain-containing protein n=1 Tax=Paeniglutamicibacter psychrophenolicus TaxID=257454 RepID=A0ABS4WA09_9MICC|nr:plasmid pRiA4b ORF-3 family protein [Paeniglutamicibacter psychrophenolicus]MBP2372758.1 hypothetical protein [Paeniglutamicibacter psychrophenolicus]
MAKKSRKSTGHRGTLAPQETGVSVWQHMARQAAARIAPDFLAWFQEAGGHPDAAGGYLEVVVAIVAGKGGRVGFDKATEFTADGVGMALERISDAVGDQLPKLVEGFHLFVDFLDQTGLWSGTREDFAAVHAMVSNEETCMLAGPFFRIPQLSEAEVRQELAKTKLVGQVQALLEWVGTGKTVTNSGALRLPDLEAAAACVGVAVRSHKLRPDPGENTIPGLEIPGLAEVPEDVLYVRTMKDIPLLQMLWLQLVDEGTVLLEGSRAVPGEGALALADPDSEGFVQACRLFISGFLDRWLEDVMARGPLGEETGHLLVSVFGNGTTEIPMAVDAILSLEPDAGAEIIDLTKAAQDAALLQLRQLAEYGLLAIDSHIVVPPALIDCFVAAFETDYKLDVEYPQGNLGIAAPVELKSVFHLKISLAGARPPVWRRFLVRSDTTFQELHHVIQASFSWNDLHLHEFRFGGRHGKTIGPLLEDELFMGGADLDEARVELSEVLAKRGDKMTYTYDFGAGWEHDITLEGRQAPRPGQELPLYITGKGEAPFED